MSNNSNSLEWMRKLPTWIGGAIAFVTVVISFVNLLRGNFYLGITILGILILASLLFVFLYLSFATTQSVVVPGRRIYRFGKYRPWAMAGIVLVVLVTAMIPALKPSRAFIVTAFVGTPTPTPALTLTSPHPEPAPSPTPPVIHTPTPTLAEMVTAASVPTSTPPSISIDCTPSDLSELPPQSTAIIEPLDGPKSQVAFSTLRYDHGSRLTLASGIMIDFKKMKRFELSNPGFTTDFAADIVITFLDCKIHSDRIQSRSGSFLTAETELGPLSLHILEVKRVDFQW